MKVKDLWLTNRKKAIELGKEETAVKQIITAAIHCDDSLYLHYDEDIADDVQNQIDKYLIDNIPAQYIIGYSYFYGLKLKVTSDVLIPRFCTEEVVTEALNKKHNKVLDIGTGSGAIAIAIKKNSEAKVTAVDVSRAALEVAKENAKINDVNVTFIESDLFSNVTGKFDMIVSNPPYIADNDFVQEIVKNNEPHLALFAKEEGLFFYRKILEQAENYLEDKYTIIFEIGCTQAEAVKKLALDNLKDVNVIIKNDLENLPRVVIITKE